MKISFLNEHVSFIISLSQFGTRWHHFHVRSVLVIRAVACAGWLYARLFCTAIDAAASKHNIFKSSGWKCLFCYINTLLPLTADKLFVNRGSEAYMGWNMLIAAAACESQATGNTSINKTYSFLLIYSICVQNHDIRQDLNARRMKCNVNSAFPYTRRRTYTINDVTIDV